MASGLPVAFSFLLVDMVGAYLFFGGEVGLGQLILSFLHSVPTFVLVPVPLFTLMGEIMFHSGMAPRILDALEAWLWRIPGRLGLLAVGSGTLFSALSGSSMSSIAMLGSTLVPEMDKRGYKKSMSIGPIMGSGGLAMIIPPSAVAVILAGLGKINVGKLLISGIIPGMGLALFYAAYIVIRCRFQPWLTPDDQGPATSVWDRLISLFKYVLPLSLIVFLVVGLIFLGVTTPSEAAATGTIGSLFLAFFYKRLSWLVLKKSIIGTIRVSVMVFTTILGATAFSQILAASGASRGLVQTVLDLPLSPVMVMVSLQVFILIMGCMEGAVSIMMLTIPIFMPIVNALGIDPVWFGLITLINLETGGITPPFGFHLYVMKAVAPGTTLEEIIGAGLPFVLCNLLMIALIIIFPQIALWLPSVMK